MITKIRLGTFDPERLGRVRERQNHGALESETTLVQGIVPIDSPFIGYQTSSRACRPSPRPTRLFNRRLGLFRVAR